MMQTSIYDQADFFELYQKLRKNPISLNEIVEKPTMFAMVGDVRNKSILDLGCGTGSHLLHYLQQGAKQVIGIDLSTKMLEQAAKNLKSAGFNTDQFKLFAGAMQDLDRKSTRLNSSHVSISYAVFCLKKKIRKDNY